jgi:hypothetical protein
MQQPRARPDPARWLGCRSAGRRSTPAGPGHARSVPPHPCVRSRARPRRPRCRTPTRCPGRTPPVRGLAAPRHATHAAAPDASRWPVGGCRRTPAAASPAGSGAQAGSPPGAPTVRRCLAPAQAAPQARGKAFSSARASRHCGQCRSSKATKRSLCVGSSKCSISYTTTYSTRSLGFFTSSVLSRIWSARWFQLPHLVFIR